MTKYLVLKFVNRAIDWLFRQRTVATTLVRVGGTIMAVSLAGGFAVSFMRGDVQGNWAFKLDTSSGLPVLVTVSGFLIGAALAIVGLYLLFIEMGRDARRKMIVIELRGLRASTDSPSQDADFGGDRVRRDELLVDLRQGVTDGLIVSPEAALTKLTQMPMRLDTMRNGLDRRDLQVAIGGLAPVPFLFLAGALLDDESPTFLYDWDRNNKIWRSVDGVDDGHRFTVSGLDELPHGCDQVVMAISVSYRVDLDAINKSFTNYNLVQLTLSEIRPDAHWSSEKQIALTAQFIHTLFSITSKAIRRVHIVFAGPASLALRFGMGYDTRNMPNVVVHQYEKSAQPPYPWGVRLPEHGNAQASIVRAPAFLIDDISATLR